MTLALNGQLQTIASGTGQLCAYVKGQGSPLILVHTINASASAAEVRPIFESLCQHRTVYAIDLPGYGFSERADRLYTPRLMTDAIHDLVKHIQTVHGPQAIDALAVSLSCEFLARAAVEQPTHFQTISLVSPTGFTGLKLRQASEGQTYGLNWLLALLKGPGWGLSIFKLLTKPKVIRYFLKKTWGSPNIDEEMFDYAVWTTQQPGAQHAPLSFLSAQLFSADITNIYDRLSQKVWMSHGTRGDFVDYRGKKRYAHSGNWCFTIYESGALPYFEKPEQFSAALLQFISET
ncbi:MAG: alpha/beta hydrolase [Betaproteobacteria bacterium]